jgi:2,5-dioxopentanoate dehydrogenase
LLSDADAVKLVAHPAIKAVGFTGSRKVGMLLFNAAAKRPEPIPVFAEMSAINPVILLEGALRDKKEEIATGLANSVNMGVGQFCTNPGLILMVESRAGEEFLHSFGQALSLALPGSMLSKNICDAFAGSIAAVESTEGITVLARARQQAASDKNEGQPVAFTVSATDYLLNKQLSAEVFGPSTLLVLCKDAAQLQQILHQLEGQLTVTIHATARDEEQVKPLLAITTHKAGRIIYGGYPTGVEVCHSMQHGGPFPATTDGRATSVGTAAIYRFLRPVAFQDLPEHLLPEALKNANPLHILRLVNGKWTSDQIG